MEFKKKDDDYEDYQSYSASVLKTREVSKESGVQGYAAAEKEERDHSVPVETMRMVNDDGVFSVGINRNREATFALTSDTAGPLLREDRTVVRMDSALRVREVSDQVYTNSHDPKISGIVYKEDLLKSPRNMVNALKSALENQENIAAQAVTPFLSGRQDKQEKKNLEEYLRDRLEQRDQEGYRSLKIDLDRLNTKISRKEAQESRLIHNLTSAAEKMREEAAYLEDAYRQANPANIQLLEPDEEKDDEEGKNNNKKK